MLIKILNKLHGTYVLFNIVRYDELYFQGSK